MNRLRYIFILIFIITVNAFGTPSIGLFDTSLVYTNISKISWHREFPYEGNYFYSIQFSIFPSTMIAPIIKKYNPDLYSQGEFYNWNIFDIFSSGYNLPYQTKLFYGFRSNYDDKSETIRGIYYQASLHSKINNYIIPYHNYETGFEFRYYQAGIDKAESIRHFSAGLGVYGAKYFQTVFITRYAQKGFFPNPWVSFHNFHLILVGRYSFASSFDRSFSTLIGRPLYLRPWNKFSVYIIPNAGFRLFVPVDINLDTFEISSNPPTIAPLLAIEFRIPSRNLVFE